MTRIFDLVYATGIRRRISWISRINSEISFRLNSEAFLRTVLRGFISMQSVMSKTFIVVIASILVAQNSYASLFTQVDLSVNRQELDPPGPNQNIFVDRQQSSSVSTPIGDSINPSVPYIAPSSVARARTGVLQAGVNAEANIPGVSYLSSSGRAEARWSARTVVELEGVATGTAASVPVTMSLRGQLGYSNNGYGSGTVYTGSSFLGLNLFSDNGANGAYDLSFTAGYVDSITESNPNRFFRITTNDNGNVYFPVDMRPPGTSETYLAGGEVTALINFLIGVPFDLTARLVTNAQAAVGDSGRLDFFSTATNTAVWSGFGDISIGGVVYSDFTAIDQFSGLDLRRAIRLPTSDVVAPATLWLLGLGLPLLFRTVRPKRRR